LVQSTLFRAQARRPSAASPSEARCIFMQIREYRPEHDLPAHRACAVELQEFERALDPRLPDQIHLGNLG
ncbi:MAG TPA: hypothetical protein VHX68_11400, partial [Planctomycetaceae bacterium]|nr:hypothetical protein [Planctomycetaceae bacterium]